MKKYAYGNIKLALMSLRLIHTERLRYGHRNIDGRPSSNVNVTVTVA